VRRFDHSALQLDAEIPNERTLIGDLTPQTKYFSRLVVIDAAGPGASSEVVQLRTRADPARDLVIFADENTAGYSIPAELALSSRAPCASTHHYA
jgi:hypothetical protein